MVRGRRVERGLAVVGAAAVLVVGFDAVTCAATGSSLLLGRVNQAGAVTTVQNTGPGAALNLVTKSTASPPFTTNARGVVPNLFAGRAVNADRVGGLTVPQVRAGVIQPAKIHLVGQAGEPAFTSLWTNFGAGYSPVSFRKDQFGVVHLGGLACDRYSACTHSVLGDSFLTVFTLPAGYRPAARTLFSVDDSGAKGRLDVLPTGEVQVQDHGVFHDYVALDGVSFVAAG